MNTSFTYFTILPRDSPASEYLWQEETTRDSVKSYAFGTLWVTKQGMDSTEGFLNFTYWLNIITQ